MTEKKRKPVGKPFKHDEPGPSESPVRLDAQTSLSGFAGAAGSEEFVRECCHCGTEIEFEIDRCPICGTRLGSPDSGIVEFIEGAEFADDSVEGQRCPGCGKPVQKNQDECPSCGERLVLPGQDQAAHMDPIIDTDRVVFLHLDVSTGELDYLRRLENRQGFGQATVQISTDNENKGRHGVR